MGCEVAYGTRKGVDGISRLAIRYLVDILLLATFLLSFITSIKYVFIPGYARGQVLQMHLYTSLAFSALVVAHLAFNARGLVATTKKLFRR